MSDQTETPAAPAPPAAPESAQQVVPWPLLMSTRLGELIADGENLLKEGGKFTGETVLTHVVMPLAFGLVEAGRRYGLELEDLHALITQGYTMPDADTEGDSQVTVTRDTETPTG